MKMRCLRIWLCRRRELRVEPAQPPWTSRVGEKSRPPWERRSGGLSGASGRDRGAKRRVGCGGRPGPFKRPRECPVGGRIRFLGLPEIPKVALSILATKPGHGPFGGLELGSLVHRFNLGYLVPGGTLSRAEMVAVTEVSRQARCTPVLLLEEATVQFVWIFEVVGTTTRTLSVIAPYRPFSLRF